MSRTRASRSTALKGSGRRSRKSASAARTAASPDCPPPAAPPPPPLTSTTVLNSVSPSEVSSDSSALGCMPYMMGDSEGSADSMYSQSEA